MPNAHERPFQPKSIWNDNIPTTALYADVPTLASRPVGLSSWLQPDYSSVPVFQATTADHKVSLLYNPNTWTNVFSGAWQHLNNAEGVEQTIRAQSSSVFPYPYHTYVSQSATGFQLDGPYNAIPKSTGAAPQFYIPADAHPTVNADGHMVVYQPDGRVLETFGTLILGDGTVVAQSYNITDPSLNGDGLQNGVTASMIPVYAGLITQDDINRGAIDHAMKIVVPAGLLDPSYMYPALSFDRGALTENPAYSGSLPMGAQLALPKSVDLASLGLQSPIGKLIAAAAQQHGFIVTDRGGDGVTVMTEQHVTTPALDNWDWALDGDLKKIMAATKRVTLDGADSWTGGAYGDVFHAQNGNDRLDGAGGNDTLYGDGGNDTLDGGAGDDLLYGGAGADTFLVTSLNNGVDRVADFSTAQDRIDLTRLETSLKSTYGAKLAADHLRIVQNGANAEIRVDVDGTAGAGAERTVMVLDNVSAASLKAGSTILGASVADATQPATSTTSIVVNAFGSAAAGVNAHFKVLVDGQQIGAATAATGAKDFAFSASVTAGVGHKVAVQFDNDGVVNGQDRNLFVNKITINGIAVAPTDVSVSYDRGALDGKDVLPGQSAMHWNGTLIANVPASGFQPSATAASLSVEDDYVAFLQRGLARMADHAAARAEDNKPFGSFADHAVHSAHGHDGHDWTGGETQMFDLHFHHDHHLPAS